MTVTRRGCIRPVIVSIVATLGVVLAALVVNSEVARVMWSNAQEARRGAEEAGAINSPADLLERIESGAIHGALVVLDGRDSVLVRAGAAGPLPATGIDRLLVLDMLRLAIDRGRLGWEDPVHAADLEAIRVAPVDGRAGADTASGTTVRQVARAMLRTNDQAARDYLLLFASAPMTGGVAPRADGLEEPVAMGGLYLLWQERSIRDAVRDAVSPDGAGTPSPRELERSLADRLARETLAGGPATEAPVLSVREQAGMAERHFSRGAPEAYARLLADLLAVPEIDSLLAAPGAPIRSVGGAFPGMISLAAAVRSDSAAVARVAVLQLHRLPGALFASLTRTGMARALLLEALLTPGEIGRDGAEG